jgi:hypothetical protein
VGAFQALLGLDLARADNPGDCDISAAHAQRDRDGADGSESDGAQLAQLGGDLSHAVGGLVVLLVITALNVYKPHGLTPYGWRKQQELRATLARQNLACADVRAV